jgi:xanthine dehydrogenase YagS FAD-binding subunit
MQPFQYCSPRTEAEAVTMLADGPQAAVLAGGTDLLSLLKSEVLGPQRVVDITGIDSLRAIEPTEDGGVRIGTLATFEDVLQSPLLADYPALSDVIRGVRAIQIQQQGTVGGDLCCLPNCWYFRNGFGLLAREHGTSLPEAGDNRYHAIFGNAGPAKFVSASRLAPAFIAWGARVRIAGPRSNDERWLPLADFFHAPRTDAQGINLLRPGQLLTHIELPATEGRLSAAYEVLELNGLDWPQAACAATLDLDEFGIVRQVVIVLGHVAPTPWYSVPASSALVGRPISEETAEFAALAAIEEATPLSGNEYKVYQAKAAVKRAILRAVGAEYPSHSV